MAQDYINPRKIIASEFEHTTLFDYIKKSDSEKEIESPFGFNIKANDFSENNNLKGDYGALGVLYLHNKSSGYEILLKRSDDNSRLEIPGMAIPYSKIEKKDGSELITPEDSLVTLHRYLSYEDNGHGNGAVENKEKEIYLNRYNMNLNFNGHQLDENSKTFFENYTAQVAFVDFSDKVRIKGYEWWTIQNLKKSLSEGKIEATCGLEEIIQNWPSIKKNIFGFK